MPTTYEWNAETTEDIGIEGNDTEGNFAACEVVAPSSFVSYEAIPHVLTNDSTSSDVDEGIYEDVRDSEAEVSLRL